MATNNKHKDGVLCHDDAPQLALVSLSDEQQYQSKDGADTGNQIPRLDAHQIPALGGHAQHQMSSGDSLSSMDAPGPTTGSVHSRQRPSTRTFEHNQYVTWGAYDDSDIFNDTVNMNLDWAAPQPTLPGINNMVCGGANAAGPPSHFPSYSHAHQQSTPHPPPYASTSVQHRLPPAQTRHQLSFPNPTQFHEHQEIEMRASYRYDPDADPLAVPYGDPSYLESPIPGTHSLGLNSDSPFNPSLLDPEILVSSLWAPKPLALDPLAPNPQSKVLDLSVMSASRAEVRQTTRLILDFDGFEDAKGTKPPDQSSVVLVHSTAAGAEQAMKDQFRSSKDYWESPNPDSTLPQTSAQREEVVRILLAAMKDPTQAIDKDKDTFRMRWAPDAEGKYDDITMEATCHKIADLTERLHLEGPTVLCVASGNALKTMKRSAPLTYTQRIRYIVVLLSEFKARCEGVIKGATLHTVVGNPQEALATSRANYSSNMERQKDLAYSRAHRLNTKRKRITQIQRTLKTESASSDNSSDEVGEHTQSEFHSSNSSFIESNFPHKRQRRVAAAKIKQTRK